MKKSTQRPGKLRQKAKQTTTVRQRIVIAATLCFAVAMSLTVYLQLSQTEEKMAATGEHVNEINYRSTNTSISTRYLRPAEQIVEDHKNLLKENGTTARITMPSRATDINQRILTTATSIQ